MVTATIPLAHVTRRIPRRYLLAAVAIGLAAGSVGSAVAPTFAILIASRIFTATAQAIFWAIGPLEAASLVRPERRARALTAVFAGSALGQVLGLPFGTAIGHAAGWRVAFLVLAGAAVVLLAAIVWALPTRAPRPPHADADGQSDRTRYRALIVFTALAVTANFAMFTYAAAFLVKVSGLPRSSVALVLFVAGAGFHTRSQQRQFALPAPPPSGDSVGVRVHAAGDVGHVRARQGDAARGGSVCPRGARHRASSRSQA